MNPRSSVGLVCLFLAIFWICGLYSAMNQTKYDETRVMPDFSARSDKFAIDRVELDRTPTGGTKESYVFTHADDVWTLKQDNQSIKVEGFRIKEMITQARGATRDQDVILENSPAAYGLEPPQATVTFFGTRKAKEVVQDIKDILEGKKPEKKETGPATTTEWKLYLGKESPDKKLVYVRSSDRPGRIFAVGRNDLSSFFFTGPNDLRSKRLFDFNEPIVTGFTIKEGDRTFEAKKDPQGTWMIEKPLHEFADYDGPPLPKQALELRPLPGGLKGLITSIATLRVDSDDDFIAAAPDNLKKFELEPGKESLRIEISSGDPKRPTVDTLLVGKREKDFAYARLGSDEGVFKLRTKYLDPILAALADPKKFRSVDLSPIPIRDADMITIQQGKSEVRFLAGESPIPDAKMPDERKAWQIDMAGKRFATAPKGVESLLDTLTGRRDILAYKDGDDAKKLDAELGLDAPTLTVSVYRHAVADPRKKELEPKKDAKAAIVWEFGKTIGDAVAVKRTAEGQVDRFTVAKSVPEKIVPAEGFLAYFEQAFPRTSVGEVVRLEIKHGGKDLVLVKSGDEWKLGTEKPVAADKDKVRDLLVEFAAPPVVRWVKTLDAKDDLAKYGLTSPLATLTFTEKTDRISPQTLASALGQLADVVGSPGLSALGAAYANQKADAGAKSELVIGSRSKDEDAYYAHHSGGDRLGLIPARLVRMLEGVDLRDASLTLAPSFETVATIFGVPKPLAASPLSTGILGTIDPASIVEVKIRVRTSVELRNFAFRRGDKGWTEAGGLKEFHGDDAKIEQAAALAANPKADRWVAIAGGPSPDQKLTPDDASVIIDALGKDGKTTTLTVGADFFGIGYFAQSSAWPGAVFLVNADRIRPMLSGASFFAKERVAANGP